MKRNCTLRLSPRHRFALGSIMAGLGLIPLLYANAQMNTPTPPPATNVQTETATLGGGCFWCLEAVYQTVPGVISVTSGYAGGHLPNPTYKAVCTGKTGHAEVVQIRFNPTVITYDGLLKIFWDIHDPTTLNRQGNDIGPQYRSIILYHNDAQKNAAAQSKAETAKRILAPVVTEIIPLNAFYPAENYHQDYFARNTGQPYCQMVIRPKLEKFLKHQKPQ